MVVSADVNAKRQAGGDENRRTLPPCAPCPLRAPRESKIEKIPQTKNMKIERPTFLLVLFVSLSALNRAVSLRPAGRRAFVLLAGQRVNRAPCRAREGGPGDRGVFKSDYKTLCT